MVKQLERQQEEEFANKKEKPSRQDDSQDDSTDVSTSESLILRLSPIYAPKKSIGEKEPDIDVHVILQHDNITTMIAVVVMHSCRHMIGHMIAYMRAWHKQQ